MNIWFEKGIKEGSMEERDDTTSIMVLSEEVYLEILGRDYTGL